MLLMSSNLQKTLRPKLFSPFIHSKHFAKAICQAKFEAQLVSTHPIFHGVRLVGTSTSVVKNKVAIGTSYEESVVCYLRELSIISKRCGGPGDLGIDFRGVWTFPDKTTRLRVVGQCKASKTKASSSVVRDLESVVLNEPPNTIGILVTSNGLSKNSLSRLCTSPLPLVLATIPRARPVFQEESISFPPTANNVSCEEFLLNHSTSALLQNKLSVTKTYNVNLVPSKCEALTESENFQEKYEISERITLLFKGMPLMEMKTP